LLINVDFFKFALWNRINEFAIHVRIKAVLLPKVKTANQKGDSPESLRHSNRAAPAPIPAGLANPAPARPCVGRWPFAPVLAASQTLQSATMSR
jgi:hypothetical protein